MGGEFRRPHASALWGTSVFIEGGHVLIATAVIVSIAGYILLRRGGRSGWSAVYGAILLFSLIFSIFLFLVWALKFFFHIDYADTMGVIGFLMPAIAAWIFWTRIRPLL